MQDLRNAYFTESDTGLTGRESMTGTANTVSAIPPYQPEGSVSEASAGVGAGAPGPVLPAVVNEHLSVDFSQHANPPDPYHLDERTPGGGRWTVAPDEAQAGRASRPATDLWKKV